MDAFFASVELRERPDLVGLPVVVSSHHPRAVIAAASYPARAFGLRSAMPMHQAKKRCPNVVVIEPHFDKYRAVSKQIHNIFARYTEHIEPLSLDEAYLDVSHLNPNDLSATAAAERIRAEIFQETGLTASAGVAPNKFLAKVASDWHKPNGLCVIKPHQVQDFIRDLPLKKIPGVGRVTQAKLEQLGLQTLGDVQAIEQGVLLQHFGKYGKQLFDYAHGIDHRTVQASRARQQISKETTFDRDLTLVECQPAFAQLLAQVWQIMSQKQLSARGVSIKLKRPDFKLLQHSRSYRQPFQSSDELTNAFRALLMEIQREQQLEPTQRYRLVGFGVYALAHAEPAAQLALW